MSKTPPGPSAPPARDAVAPRAHAYRLLGMSWDQIAEQLAITPAEAQDQVRQALRLPPGCPEELLQEELDRQAHDALFARTQIGVTKGETPAIRLAAKLLASRPRKSAKPPVDPLRSAVRRGLARGLSPQRILAEFPECRGKKIAEIRKIYREEEVSAAPTPQAQRTRRIAELEAIKRDAPDHKTLMAALRILVKIDGSQEPAAASLYDEVWNLLARLEDYPFPASATAPRRPSGPTERRLWRARLQRLRSLLLRAADDIAAFRRLGGPPVGAVVHPKDKSADRLGRMSAINLYAQEHAAVALAQAASNPAASPTQRAEAVSRIVGTIAMNHPSAEISEWANELVGRMKDDEEGAPPPDPDGAE